MSDISGANLDTSAGNSQVITEPVVEQQEPAPTIGADFLKNIPTDDRPYVEKYIKDWDRSVNERFDKIHSEYKTKLEPWEQYGDPDSVSKAVQLAQVLEENPEYVYKLLHAEYGESLQQQNQQVTKPEVPAHLEGLPEQFITAWQERESMMENMARLLVSNQETTRAKEEDAQLDAMLKGLKEKHGDFNENFVLAQLDRGVKPDAAIKEWKDLVQSVVNSQSKPLPQPPTTLGGGPLPSSGRNIAELSRGETQDLVTSMLEKAKQS